MNLRLLLTNLMKKQFNNYINLSLICLIDLYNKYYFEPNKLNDCFFNNRISLNMTSQERQVFHLYLGNKSYNSAI